MHKLLFVCLFLFVTICKADSRKPIHKATQRNVLVKLVKFAFGDTIRLDTSKVSVRAFNADALEKYKNNADFDYREAVAKPGLNWWQRFWNWFWDIIASLFGSDKQTQGPSLPFLKYIIEGGAVALLLFIVIKLAGLNISNLFRKDAAEIQLHYSESLENIHQITFEEEIEKALHQRNYRLAIRLLYLSTLKQLNDAHLIQWQLEKTNSAYISELSDAAQRQFFGILTRQFEYVWYGDFPVDGQSFQHINTLFHDFKTMLK